MKILILILCLYAVSSITYKKVVHNFDPQAKCLDGTPGLLYVHEGGDPSKILIFFEGGGLCGDVTLDKTLESCYQRSKTLLGSSIYWPEQFTETMVQGYLSLNPTVNPFANWTKFIFGYCDGSLHQGYNPQPVKYKDAQLYFRGGAITRSHFDWINQHYGLKNASKIILTGGSAGGIGVHLWNNYLKSYVNNPNVVYSIDDSGVFINTKTDRGVEKIQSMIQNIYKISNVKESTPFNQCNNFYRNSEWKCLFFQYGYAALKGKFMVINSQYDSWAIPNILEVKCLKAATVGGQTIQHCSKTQINQIQAYRSIYMDVIEKFIAVNPEGSVWTIACSNHVYACLDLFYDSPFQRVPYLSQNTVKQAIYKFVMQDQKITNFDVEKWPANKACEK